jgi:hypothetical protein
VVGPSWRPCWGRAARSAAKSPDARDASAWASGGTVSTDAVTSSKTPNFAPESS